MALSVVRGDMYPGLEDNVALVTGANAGIGRAIAARLAANGAVVVALDITATPRDGGPAVADVVDTDDTWVTTGAAIADHWLETH